jgi:hypothetical protein
MRAWRSAALEGGGERARDETKTATHGKATDRRPRKAEPGPFVIVESIAFTIYFPTVEGS